MTHFSFSGRSLLVAALLLLTGRIAAQAQNVGIGTTTPGSLLTVNGSFAGGYSSVTAATYSLLDNDYYVTWNGTAAGTFTLPAPAAAKKGRIYKIRNNTTTFALSLTTGSALNIDAAASLSLPAGSTIELIANGNTTGTVWEVVTLGTPASTGTASGTLGGAGGACSPAPTLGGANFVPAVPNAGQSLTVTVTVNTPGDYTLGTNTVNGMGFSASGYFSTTGVQTVALYATGTPVASGTFAYTVAYGSSLCTTNVTVPVATFACASATQTQSPGGIFVNGTSYSGNYTVSYTGGNGLTYPSSVQTTSGLSFTRTAGTYATGSGSIVYTLSGTYTGTTGTAVTFNVPECTTVTYGVDALRTALASTGCASCATYDAAAVNTWVNITAADFTALRNNVSGMNTYGATAAQMATTSSFGWQATYTVTLNFATASLIPTANYPVAMAVRNGSTVPTTMNGIKLKLSAAGPTSGYQDFPSSNISTPTTVAAVAANTIYYFMVKRPIFLTTAATYVAIYSSYDNQVGSFSSPNGNYYAPSDSSSPNTSNNNVQEVQVLSTAATKQW